MIRVLIVDDEAPARIRLRRMLDRAEDVEIVGEAADGVQALEKISELNPDAVFLDIEMPELGGFGVAESLGPSGPSIIFVTAYDQHALRAFETAAVDYIVKPVSDQRLATAVAKLRRLARLQQAAPPRALLPSEGRFAIRCGSKFVVFDPKKVSAILARDHYAGIIVDGRELLADDSLETVAGRLRPDSFFRVHRSALINLEFLHELEREGDRKYVAVLSDPPRTRVAVARERLSELRSRLGLE